MPPKIIKLTRQSGRAGRAKRASRVAGTPRVPRTWATAGPARESWCLGCLKSALAGKDGGHGCHDNGAGGGERCFRCASGHPCEPIPAVALPAAQRFLRAYAVDTDPVESNYWRPVVRGQLRLAEEGEVAVPAAEMTEEEKKKAGRKALQQLAELLF